MRKYQWLIIVMLIGCIVAFASCERIARVIAPTMPEPEPTEVVETPPEPKPEPEVVEIPPEPEPVVVEPPPPAIEGSIVSVSPAQIASPAVGEQLQVSIQIVQAADVIGYELSLGFDPAALKYVSGSLADYLPAGAFPVITASADSVFIGGASVSGAASASSGTLATVTFEVIAEGASMLTLSEVVLFDSEGEVTPTTMDGEITAP